MHAFSDMYILILFFFKTLQDYINRLTLGKILKIKNVPDRKEIYVKVPYNTIIVIDLLVCCGF